MAHYEVKIVMCSESLKFLNATCQVEISDEEVQQLIALMQKYGTTNVDNMKLENNLPAIYEKISNACNEVTADILEKDWLLAAIRYIAYDDYDEEKLISYCQNKYGCPSFDEREDEREDAGEMDESEEYEYEGFYDWLCDFWETATPEEQKDLLFNYMGVEESYLDIARSYFSEKCRLYIPETIVKRIGITRLLDKEARKQCRTLEDYALARNVDESEAIKCFIEVYEAYDRAKTLYKERTGEVPEAGYRDVYWSVNEGELATAYSIAKANGCLPPELMTRMFAFAWHMDGEFLIKPRN